MTHASSNEKDGPAGRVTSFAGLTGDLLASGEGRVVAPAAEVSGADDAPGTPVTSLRDLLSGRLLNLLQRQGFHTVEQVAAASDDALLAIRSMGRSSVLEIRTAVAETHAAGQQGWDEVTFDSAHVRELISLLTILNAYADGREQSDVAGRARALLAVVTR